MFFICTIKIVLSVTWPKLTFVWKILM